MFWNESCEQGSDDRIVSRFFNNFLIPIDKLNLINYIYSIETFKKENYNG